MTIARPRDQRVMAFFHDTMSIGIPAILTANASTMECFLVYAGARLRKGRCGVHRRGAGRPYCGMRRLRHRDPGPLDPTACADYRPFKGRKTSSPFILLNSRGHGTRKIGASRP